MSKEKAKEVKKRTSKKPVEKTKASKKQAPKKAVAKKEAVVEPKRSKKIVVEEPIANDMVEKDKDDKIWIVIAILLVVLVGGAFITNKVVNTKKVEESSNNKIDVSKTITENNDGTVEVKVKIKSNIGLKTVTLEDGTVMNFNNKKEIEVKFNAKENGEYTLVIKDKNGTKTKKKIKVTKVKENKVAEKEDHELVVEEVAKEDYVVYYYRPQPASNEFIEETPTFDVANDSYINEDLMVNIKTNAKYTASVKFNDEEEIPYTGQLLSDEGSYIITAITEGGKTSNVHFTIDKTAPVFVELEDGETYNYLVSAIATDENLGGYIAKLNGYEISYFEEQQLQNGDYEITAYDLAGNNTTVNITVLNMPVEDHSVDGVPVFNRELNLDLDGVIIENEYQLYRYNFEINEYEQVEGFDYHNSITESGLYMLNFITNKNVTGHFTFMIDCEKPTIVINEEKVLENNTIEEVEITIEDDVAITNAKYGYTKDKEQEPAEDKKYSFLPNVDLKKPADEGNYLWVEVTDIANNVTTAVSDKTIEPEIIV